MTVQSTRQRRRYRTLFAALTGFGLVLGFTSTAAAQDTYWDGTKEIKVDCKPNVKARISKNLSTTPAQLKQGKAQFDLVCAACHGNTGLGNGPAAAALNPKPRNFGKDKFVKGTSVLALFDVTTNGLPGTAMAGFESLPTGDRWAIAHYVQSMIPKENITKISDAELEVVCVAESQPPKPPSIPVEFAMETLVNEANARRSGRLKGYGDIKLNDDGNREHGQLVWAGSCANCHGDRAEGNTNLGRYGRFPFIHISARTLIRDAAGGTWQTFVDRVDGFHQTIPSMTPTAALDERDWKSLQTFMSTLKGTAKVTSDNPPLDPSVALISVTPRYELFTRKGGVYKLNKPQTTDGEATVVQISTYAAFKALYVALPAAEGENVEPLADEQPEGGFELKMLTNLRCAGSKVGCGAGAFKSEDARAEKRSLRFE